MADYYTEVELGEGIKMLVGLEEVESSDSEQDVWDHPIESLFLESYPSPTDWVMKYTAEGRYSFYHTVTGFDTVSLPSPQGFDLKGRRLPHPWRRAHRADGQITYINSETSAIQYCSPLYQGETIERYDIEANLEMSDYLFFESC